MSSLALFAIAAGSLIVLLLLASYMSERFRFWLFDLWVRLPVLGWIDWSLGKLEIPTNDAANDRLDVLYQSYRARIQNALTRKRFDECRRYLFLAGDPDTHPAPASYIIGMMALLAAEAYSYSFVVGGAVSANASDNEVDIFAMLITAVFAGVFAILSHLVGGMFKRTRTLREAWQHALDPAQSYPGEEDVGPLVARISLDEPQERDAPTKGAIDAQRQLNRIRKSKNDRGNLIIPALFVIAIAAVAALQFELRALSTIATGAASIMSQSDLPDLARIATQQNDTAYYANIFFVIIFLLTQLVALWVGYGHKFLGQESKRAYKLIGGTDDYEAHENAWLRRVRAADKSLKTLLDRFEDYESLSKIDEAMFRERAAREGKPRPQQTSPDDGSGGPGSIAGRGKRPRKGKATGEVPRDPDNVTNFPRAGGGPK